MSKKLKLGLFGFGCVGQGLYDVLEKTDSINAEVAKICVKHRDKERPLPMHHFTFNKEDLLNDEDIDIIVEVIDTADEAFDIVSTAINKGKAVISANKKMIAENFTKLVELQNENKVSFLYEASCCASIPIIRNLEEYYDNDLLNAFEGIFNGSSNYILSSMLGEGKSYNEVLKQAQDLGYAETDPILDVGGFDSKFKLCILTAHAFGKYITPDEIFNYGIQNISDYELRYASEKRLKLKLFASSKIINGKLATWVMPQFVNDTFKLYNIEYEYNGIVLEGAFSESQFFVGKGAGGHPTGSAIISDISALTYNYKYEYKKINRDFNLERTNDFIIEIYLRYKDESVLKEVNFQTIDERFKGRGFNYVIGKLRLNDLIHSPLINNSDVFIAQTARNARELN